MLKKGEVEKAAAALNDAAANPEVLRPAVGAWKKMAPAGRNCAAKLHKPGCTSHAVNLTIEASHNKTEKQVIEENMVQARAARIITRLFHLAPPSTINFGFLFSVGIFHDSIPVLFLPRREKSIRQLETEVCAPA